MGAQVGQRGARDDLALHQPGEPPPTQDRRPWASIPKKYVDTPRSAGSAAGSTSSETHRWASARLANAARTLSSSSWPAWGTDRNAWTPVASSRPSTRRARSLLASWATARRPGSAPVSPGAGSMTTTLPLRRGPAVRILSSARSALGRPPETGGEPCQGLEGGRAAGAVRGTPLCWNSRTPWVTEQKRPSTASALKPSSRSWRCRAITSSPVCTLPGRCTRTRSPSRQWASSRAR